MNKKILAKAFVEKKDGKMVAIATDETIDRHGESLSIDAWDLKNFKKNPVLQFAHNYNLPPVGLAKKLKRDGDKLMFEPVFHEHTQLAREVKAMYEADPAIMKAFSVGFIPHYKGEGEDAKVSYELLEISAVPIPANPSAVVTEKALEKDEESEKKVNEWITKEVDQIFKVEEKAGRVISKKNRTIIQNAVDALVSVLEVDIPKEDDEKGVDLIEGTELELEIKTELPKVKKPEETKGRVQENLVDALAALEGKLGFIKREVLRQRKK